MKVANSLTCVMVQKNDISLNQQQLIDLIPESTLQLLAVNEDVKLNSYLQNWSSVNTFISNNSSVLMRTAQLNQIQQLIKHIYIDIVILTCSYFWGMMKSKVMM